MNILKRRTILSNHKQIQGYLILILVMFNTGFPGGVWSFQQRHTQVSPLGIVRTSFNQNITSRQKERSENLYQVEDQVQANEDTGYLSSNITFERISLDQGLSQSSIHTIFQDSSGFLWFGTEDGLNKYDGYSFTIYRHDPDDPYSLGDNTVLAIHEDLNGEMWIGTYGRGLNRFDRQNERFIHFRHNPSDSTSLTYDTVSALASDMEGNLWVGTWNGLDRLDAETGEFVHYKHDPDDMSTLSNDVISSLHKDRTGILWVGTYGGGLERYDPVEDEFHHYKHDIVNPDRLSSDNITSIGEDQFGNLWLTTADRGLNQFNLATKKFSKIDINPIQQGEPSHNSTTSVAVDQSGNIWVGTSEHGVDVHNPDTGKTLNFEKVLGDPSSLSQNQVNTIFVDRSGIVWVGTFGGGINKFNPMTARFTNYRHIPGNSGSLSGNTVMSIEGDNDGNLWVGIHEGGLNYINRESGEITRFSLIAEDEHSLDDDDVWDVYLDQTDKLWIATQDSGLFWIDINSGDFKNFTRNPDDPGSLSTNSLNKIYADRNGIIWIGTNGGGLDRFDELTGSFIHYRHNPDDPQSLSNNRIWTITEDRTGKLWVGTGGGGISVLNQETGKFQRYEHDPDDPDSLGDTDIFSIFEDDRGRIWIGTYGSGMDKYLPGTDKFIHYRVSDGLPNNVVYGILEDDSGYLWLSTNFGISQFDPQTETFRNFDASDGLQSNEFNVGAYFMNDSREMFFGGINGLTTFHPEDIQEAKYFPPVVFTALMRSGQEIVHKSAVDSLTEIILEWPNNNFEFEFVALNFSQPEKSKYAYILEGFDEDWNLVGNTRNGRYTNLPGGSYTLKLRITNSDGVWNEESTSIGVKVIPPFWSSWWFIAIVCLTGILGVFSGFRLRVRSIEYRSQKLEDEVKSRTKEIDQRRLELEALYQADEVIDQNLTLENRLKALVDVSVDILHADKSSIFVWDEGREEFTVKAARGFESQMIQTLSFGREEGIVGIAAQTGEPVFGFDESGDHQEELNQSEFLNIILAEGIRAYMFLPIKISNEIFGVFNVNFCEPNAFGEDEKRVFMALTQHSALSIQNARLFEQLRELAISEERSRLARDLHDSAKQKAFAALAQLGAASGMIEKDLDLTKNHLLEAEELVYEVLQELIILIQEMYPIALREKGLASSVREYIFDWENQCEIEADIKIVNERRLPLELEQSLYRIIQESLANVARHSHASKAEVSIIYNSDSVEVQVSDDGIGFDPNQQPNGLGIRSMHERVELIRGEIEIRSERGSGTVVKVVTPASIPD